ncbi:AraC family transcriptional regulator [Leucobacter sp. USCH14]|uniref:helix-turn-helix transcriptional regulator n=1 Tax=Leucobacter sp. USCH14 TaxID=3024838 RepID=UPI00309A7D92
METQRFRSSDPETVAETWREFAPSSRLLEVDEDRCKLDWFSATVDGFSVIRYELSAKVESSVAPESQLFTCSVQSLHGGVTAGRHALPSGRPWASHGLPVTAHWDDVAVVQALVFDREHAQRLARRISGDDGLSLQLRSPEARGAREADQWDRTFAYIASSVLSGDATLDPESIVGAGLLRHALWTVLSTFSTNYSLASDTSPQRSAAPTTVRRALAYIDAHAHEAITVDDVATAAHISTRGLQYAFRRSLGFTPSEYLRRARLSGAHHDLSIADPKTSVASIARRWGFSNVSRFTAAYRLEYGTHPGR